MLHETQDSAALSVSQWELSDIGPQQGNSEGFCLISGDPQACIRLWALETKKAEISGRSELLGQLWRSRAELHAEEL